MPLIFLLEETMSNVIALTPKEAYQKMQSNKDILFVDVRSCVEYKFVGHALDSVLVPWMDEPAWEINLRFCHAVSALLADKFSPLETEIILICRSGNRSKEAGKALIKKGFKNVEHIATGFEGNLDGLKQRGNLNGWCYDDLPWEQC